MRRCALATVVSMTVFLTSGAWAQCWDEQTAKTLVAKHEDGYAIAAIGLCPDKYCPSFGSRLIIFGDATSLLTESCYGERSADRLHPCSLRWAEFRHVLLDLCGEAWITSQMNKH